MLNDYNGLKVTLIFFWREKAHSIFTLNLILNFYKLLLSATSAGFFIQERIEVSLHQKSITDFFFFFQNDANIPSWQVKWLQSFL